MKKRCLLASLVAVLFIFHGSAHAFEYEELLDGIGASLDYEYQTWEPDDIYGADLLTSGINLIGLQIGYGSGKHGFSPLFRYEFAPSGDKANQDKLVELSSSGASGWERIFADFKWTFDSGSSLSFIYDKQAYMTSVQASRDYWYFENGSATLLVPGDIVRNTTVMQDTQLLYGASFGGFPIQVGVFSLSYEKPFSTDIQNGQIGIYQTQLDATGVVLKSQYESDFWGADLSYKYGFQGDLTIGASSSAAALLGDKGNTLDFSELAAAVKIMPYKGVVNLSVGYEYKVRSMSGDVQLTRDDISSLYINASKSF